MKFPTRVPMLGRVGLALWLLLPVSPAFANGLGDYYVISPVLNERSAPVDGEVVNRIYKGQKVTVYEVRNGWAQIDPPGADQRWVIMKSLSRTTPEPSTPTALLFDDTRIEAGAIPNVGDFNLSKRDVEVIWRGAKKMLDSGECSKIVSGDKSISKPNTYYVTCDDSENRFFRPEDLD